MKFREVTEGQQAAAWQIRLFGDFRLVGPDGRIRQLHNRKCEGLVALLVAHPRGARRDFLGAALWPDKSPEKQLESLRQAIAIVRREVSADFIVSTRTDCQLSGEHGYESDLDQTALRDSTIFMSANDEDWFEQMRLQEESAAGPLEEEPSVMYHYLQSLRWCARSDPKSLFAFLQANRAFVRGIPTGEILSLLEMAGNCERQSGWPHYWRGIAEDDLVLSASLLKKALRSAVKDQDWDLASDTCFELGKAHCRLGNVDKATRIANAADEVAARANTKAARINAARLRGTLLVNWGETKTGLELLRGSIELVDDIVRRAVVESTQAWFETISGYYASAAKRLEVGENLCRETGHHQAFLLTSATRAILTVYEGSRANAIPDLERVAKKSYDAGSCQFGVYAEESLAKLHFLDKDRELAKAKLNSARLNRMKSRMAQTPLESSMIAAIR